MGGRQFTPGQGVVIRPLREEELDRADYIFRMAFGTFLGIPDPVTNFPDVDLVRTRFRTDPDSFFAAELDGELVGSNFATNWGSVGFFGPLTVHPDHWDKKVGSLLMEPIMDRFSQWDSSVAGLFTFPQSGKHVGLYGKFGFWPRFLTPIMGTAARAASRPPEWTRLSDSPAEAQSDTVKLCRELTDTIYDGLDVTADIRAVVDQGLGDTVLLWDQGKLIGFAVCHVGGGSEAWSGSCYAKFAAVRPGPQAGEHFERLLDVCESFTAEQGRPEFLAGVNTAREDAYARMWARGYRTSRLQGVVMHRPNVPGYDRPDVYVLDDWR